VELSRLHVSKSRIELKAVLPTLTVTDEAGETIAKVQDFIFARENNSIFSERNTVILSEKSKFLKVGSLFLNLQQATVRHLLTIWIMMNGDATRPRTEQQEFEEYFHAHVYSRLSMHSSLEDYTEEATTVEVDRIAVITSLGTEQQYLVVELSSISYNEPTNMKPRILIRKMSLARCRIATTKRLKLNNFDKMTLEKEATLMENNKPLVIVLEKMLRKHFIDSQDKQRQVNFTVEESKTPEKGPSERKYTIKEKNIGDNKDVGYVYFEPFVDIVVPFLLIQLSFLDLLYFRVMLNRWRDITTNPYFFPSKKNKAPLSKQFGGLSQ
jgi:hypothetical protein